MVGAPIQAIAMQHDEDPKQTILNAVEGILGDITPMGADVLVAIYERPNMTKGGIILTEKLKQEDKYQGKVGLVVALGPLAFQNDATHTWTGVLPKVGDWVAFPVARSWPALYKAKTVRFVEDVAIRAVLASPDILY